MKQSLTDRKTVAENMDGNVGLQPESGLLLQP